MKNIKLGKLWDSLHTSYWFVPALMAGLAIALAFAMLTLDRAGKSGLIEKLAWIYAGGPDGARTLKTGRRFCIMPMRSSAVAVMR